MSLHVTRLIRVAATRVRSTTSLAMNRLLPSQCALCGGPGAGAVCQPCAANLTYEMTRCACCGIRLPGCSHHAQCGRCLSDPPAFSTTLIATDYAAPVDRLIQDLKFRAQLSLAPAFARLLMDKAPAWLRGFDLILPVPLSRERLVSRGFNQALEIARPIAQALAVPLAAGVCVRVRDTEAQAGLPLAQRRVNMRGAFAVSQRTAVEGKQIIVIDDVMTTGHTLNELAACLKRHGATRICNLVLARTPAA